MKKKLVVGQNVKLDDGRLDDGHEIWIGKVVKVKFFGGVDVLINAEYGQGQIMHFDRKGKEIGVDPWSLYPAWQIVDTDRQPTIRDGDERLRTVWDTGYRYFPAI